MTVPAPSLPIQALQQGYGFIWIETNSQLIFYSYSAIISYVDMAFMIGESL